MRLGFLRIGICTAAYLVLAITAASAFADLWTVPHTVNQGDPGAIAVQNRRHTPVAIYYATQTGLWRVGVGEGHVGVTLPKQMVTIGPRVAGLPELHNPIVNLAVSATGNVLIVSGGSLLQIAPGSQRINTLLAREHIDALAVTVTSDGDVLIAGRSAAIGFGIWRIEIGAAGAVKAVHLLGSPPGPDTTIDRLNNDYQDAGVNGAANLQPLGSGIAANSRDEIFFTQGRRIVQAVRSADGRWSLRYLKGQAVDEDAPQPLAVDQAGRLLYTGFLKVYRKVTAGAGDTPRKPVAGSLSVNRGLEPSFFPIPAARAEIEPRGIASAGGSDFFVTSGAGVRFVGRGHVECQYGQIFKEGLDAAKRVAHGFHPFRRAKFKTVLADIIDLLRESAGTKRDVDRALHTLIQDPVGLPTAVAESLIDFDRVVDHPGALTPLRAEMVFEGLTVKFPNLIALSG